MYAKQRTSKSSFTASNKSSFPLSLKKPKSVRQAESSALSSCLSLLVSYLYGCEFVVRQTEWTLRQTERSCVFEQEMKGLHTCHKSLDNSEGNSRSLKSLGRFCSSLLWPVLRLLLQRVCIFCCFSVYPLSLSSFLSCAYVNSSRHLSGSVHTAIHFPHAKETSGTILFLLFLSLVCTSTAVICQRVFTPLSTRRLQKKHI